MVPEDDLTYQNPIVANAWKVFKEGHYRREASKLDGVFN
jgi:hypothetical protein